jgi:hypothetical protein
MSAGTNHMSAGTSHQPMRAFISLARAMFKGFLRDRTSLFFTLFFPLFFIIIFGTVFSDQGASKQKVELVGAVPLISSLPADARAGLDEVFQLSNGDDLAAAVESVRKGDLAAAVQQQGDKIEVHCGFGHRARRPELVHRAGQHRGHRFAAEVHPVPADRRGCVAEGDPVRHTRDDRLSAPPSARR